MQLVISCLFEDIANVVLSFMAGDKADEPKPIVPVLDEIDLS